MKQLNELDQAILAGACPTIEEIADAMTASADWHKLDSNEADALEIAFGIRPSVVEAVVAHVEEALRIGAVREAPVNPRVLAAKLREVVAEAVETSVGKLAAERGGQNRAES